MPDTQTSLPFPHSLVTHHLSLSTPPLGASVPWSFGVKDIAPCGLCVICVFVAIDINRAVLGALETWWFKKKSRTKPYCQYHFNAGRYQERRSPRATTQNRGHPPFKPHFQ